MNQRPEILAWGLAVLTLIAVVVMTLTGHSIPAELWGLLTLAVGGALGLTSPSTVAAASVSPTAIPAVVAPHDQAAPSS